jgi:hypothetical protein
MSRALVFLPAVMFLIIFTQVAHGGAIGSMAVPACALSSCLSLWKPAVGAVEKPWGIFNVLSFGALFVLAGHRWLYRNIPGPDNPETLASAQETRNPFSASND